MSPVRCCRVDGCDQPSHGWGFCRPHYYRAKRHGDPLITKYGKGGQLQSFIVSILAGPPTESCIEWPFARQKCGYGTLSVDGQTRIASRYICEAAHGAPPTPKHEARHLCGRGHHGCVNPGHLVWGTQAENYSDRILHGTSNRGEQNGRSKLTEEQVRQIISRKDAGERPSKLATEFGVSGTTVHHIISRRVWAWVQPEGQP